MASLVVLSSACFIRSNVRLRRAPAMIMAPRAPIAPPSVGVAMPRKVVPSTRKISTSGGINTKVTCSARRDSRPRRNRRLSSAKASASTEPTVMDRMTTSSPAGLISRSINGLITDSCTWDHATLTAAHSTISTNRER
ncbi:hypothetical protein FQZ97_932510 [compost metagenome]